MVENNNMPKASLLYVVYSEYLEDMFFLYYMHSDVCNNIIMYTILCYRSLKSTRHISRENYLLLTLKRRMILVTIFKQFLHDQRLIIIINIYIALFFEVTFLFVWSGV